MFKPIKPYQENITGHEKEPQIRIGSVVPDHAVNLAYYYNPTATDSEKVLTADAPRNTIDHRVEDAYRYLFDQASKDDSLFPKTVTYEDEEGYVGNLGRVYVKWHEEAHVTMKNIVEKKDYVGLLNKEDVPQFIEYSKDDYTGNLFLDAVDYTVSEYTTIGESQIVEREILNHELTTVVAPKDLNFWMKNPVTDSSSPWPKTLTVSETMIVNSGGRYVPNSATNPYDKFTGELVFSGFEYEEVRTSTTPSPEFTSEIGIITFISATTPAGYVTADKKEAAKEKFDALTKDLYATGTTEPYDNSEIKSFMDSATYKYVPTRMKTVAYLDILENMNNVEQYGYIIQKEDLKEHTIVDKEVTKYFFTKTFKVTKLTRGREAQRYFAVYANYVGVLTKSVSTEKKVPYKYNAKTYYKGMARKVWYDYDGVAYYRGSIIKTQSIGNMNDELSNEVLMFPDENGKLFRLLSTGGKSYKLEAEQFYITNVFKDNVPCWYQYKLKYPIYDYKPANLQGFYTGENVKVYSSNLKSISDDDKYQLKLVPKEYETVETVVDGVITSERVVKNYDVYLYTSFVSKATNTYSALYNAYINEDNYLSSNNGITEDIYNTPFMLRDIDYTINEVDSLARENEIVIKNPVVIEDTRRRVSFQYRIVAKRKTDNKEVASIIRVASILNKEYALEIELSQFKERAMIISPKSEDGYLSPMDLVLQDQALSSSAPALTKDSTDFVFYAELVTVTNEQIGGVNLNCNPDGSGVITAETTLDTGFYNSVSSRYTDKLTFSNPYYIDGNKIYAGYMVKCLDSRSIGINQPREDKLLESWYPMIRFGHYSQTLTQYGVDKRVIYSMPEYDTQYFSTRFGKPYVDVYEEKAEILNNHMIKVKCTPLFIYNLEDINANVNVIKRGQEDIKLTVTDISYTDGVIFIKESISENDSIYVDYIYFEENYVYRGYWRDLDFCRIDLNPNQYHTYSDLNKIPSVTSPTKNLFNKTIYFYLKPSCYRTVEKWTEQVEREITRTIYEEVTHTWKEDDLTKPIYQDKEVIVKEEVEVDTTSEGIQSFIDSNQYFAQNTEGGFSVFNSSTSTSNWFTFKNNILTFNRPNTTNSYGLVTLNSYDAVEFEFIYRCKDNTMLGNSMYVAFFNPASGSGSNAFDSYALMLTAKYKNSVTIGNTVYNSTGRNFYIGKFKQGFSLANDHFNPTKSVSDSTFPVIENGNLADYPNGIRIKVRKTIGGVKIWRSELNNPEVLLPDPVLEYSRDEIKTSKFAFGIHDYSKNSTHEFEIINFKTFRTEIKENVIIEKELVGYEQIEKSETTLVPKEITETVIETIEHENRDETTAEKTLYHTIDVFEPESEMDLYIGSVYIRQNTSLESTVLVDTRTRGGGVQEYIKDDLRRELEPESDFYLDIGYYDGKPYQENGVIIVRLDNSILKENGGRFTQSDVEEKVKKWLAYGVYPIIEYVDTYSKYEMPQYNLTVTDNYTNVQYDPIIFYLDCVNI